MIKLSRTGITTLKRQYRSVLLKCLLINAGILLAGGIATPANATQTITDTVLITGGTLTVQNGSTPVPGILIDTNSTNGYNGITITDGNLVVNAGNASQGVIIAGDGLLRVGVDPTNPTFQVSGNGNVTMSDTTKTNFLSALGISGGGSGTGITIADVVNSAKDTTTTDALGTYLNSTYATTAALADYSTTAQMNTAITDGAIQTIASGDTAGTLKIDGTDVAITTFDAAGAAAQALTDAKAYVDGKGYQTSDQVSTAISNAITALDLANTYDAKGAAAAVQGGTTSTVKDVEDALAGKQNAITTENKLSATLVSGLATVATTGAAADITTDTTHRFVTDAEKTTWSGKQDAITTTSKLSSSLVSFTEAEANALASGITSAKVSTYDGYATSKQDKLAAVNAGNGISIDTSGADPVISVKTKTNGGINAGSDGIEVLTGATTQLISGNLEVKHGAQFTNDTNGLKLAANAVDTNEIKNGAVTYDKLSNTAIATSITGATNKIATDKAVQDHVKAAAQNADYTKSASAIDLTDAGLTIQGALQTLDTTKASLAHDNTFAGTNTFTNGVNIGAASSITEVSGLTFTGIGGETETSRTVMKLDSANALLAEDNVASKSGFSVVAEPTTGTYKELASFNANGIQLSDGTNINFTADKSGNVTAAGKGHFGNTTNYVEMDAGALTTTGNASVGGTLGVTGATTLNDTLTVAKAATLNDTLTVAKAATLNDTLTVAKAATLNDTLTVAKAATLNDTLTVAKTATFGAAGSQVKLDEGVVTADKGLVVKAGGADITGDSKITGKLEVTNVASLNGGILVNDNFKVTTTGNVTANSYKLGNNKFAVTSTGNVTGQNITAEGKLNVAGVSNLSGGINVNDKFKVTTTGNVTTQNLTTEGTLTVAKAATLNDTLTVKKLTTLNSDTGLTFDGDTTKVVKAIDDGSAKQTSASTTKATDMATVATVLKSAENAEYTGTTKPFSGTIATVKDSLNLIGDLSEFASSTTGTLTNNGEKNPETVATAIVNIDKTLGQIHGLADKLRTAGTYKGNLAEGTTVEQHLTAIDAAIGDRSQFATGRYTATSENVADATMALDKGLSNLADKVRDFKKEFKSGMAQMAAMSALVPNARAHGNTQISVGTGAYSGQTAAAIGGFHWVNDNLMLNIGASYGDSNNMAYRAGLTWSW